MNRLASLSLFGLALAVVLAFGIPGKASAGNNTTGRLILAGDLGITLGNDGGIGIELGKDKADKDKTYDRDKSYDRDRDKTYDRDYDQERTYDMGGSPRF